MDKHTVTFEFTSDLTEQEFFEVVHAMRVQLETPMENGKAIDDTIVSTETVCADKFLSEKTRDDIIEFKSSEAFSCMFGDGLEDDYIRGGMDFKGYENYTDMELLEEIRGQAEDDELRMAAEAEYAIHTQVLS